MEDNIAVLVDAKIEYTKQLTNILIPFIFEGIKSIYSSTKSICKMKNDKSVLMRFQEQLSQIPKWNQEIIEEEYNRIISNSNCDWLDDLVTAVFLSHTKILTAIKSGTKQNKINLKIPKIDHFIHKCYIESAREFWKNPYIFSNNVSQSEYQRNISDGHKMIGSCIEETIRKLLPVKNILKEYLGPNYEEDDKNSLLPENYKNNLRKLVQKEMEICKKEGNIDEEKIIKKLENISNIDEEDIEEINIGLKPKSNEFKVENLNDEVTIEEISNPENDNNSEKNNLDLDLDFDKITQNNDSLDMKNELQNIDLSKKTDNTQIEGDNTTISNIEPDLEDINLDNLENIDIFKSDINNTESNKEVNLEENKQNKLDETNLEETNEVKLEESNEVNLEETNLEKSKEVKLKETNLEEPKEVKLEETKEVKLDEHKEVKLEESNLEESKEVKLEEPKEVKLEENKEVKLEEPKEVKLEESQEVNLEEPKEVKLEESKEVNLENNNLNLDNNEINLNESDINKDEINEVKNIISNDLYNKDLLINSDDETIIEDMKFKKVDLDSLNLDNLNDIDMSELETFNSKDITLDEEKKLTKEVVDNKKDTKTIVIDSELNNLTKYSKPKKKSYKFFD